ncbi:uncharacterized protein LOC118404424 [Branchiostoma floridae]|uniref:Uncharacterized protein LOC118404424 n=1 Tax=Branchiostoma floridae TaxID=7739 RepID=A0A9J7KER5_BRAFL|nr:uncharacterized protein LOC118404424 [Branchiostoma floridae]
MARSWKRVLLAVFLLMFGGLTWAEDQQQQTLEVSLGGVLVLTFQPFDRNKMFLVKRKEGEVTNIKVRTWSSWTAGSVPNLTDQASDDPAFDGRVDSTYVNVSNTLTVRIKDFRAADTGLGVYYEFQQSGSRSSKFYPNIKVPPPRISSFNITGVGEDNVNITFQQVEPWDSAPVNYSVQYQELGASSWKETESVPHDPNIPSRQIPVKGLKSGVKYQFRVVSANDFGRNYSHIEEATTRKSQRSTGFGFSNGAIASIVVCILVLLLLVAVAFLCHQHRKRNKKWSLRDRRRVYNPVPLEEGRNGLELQGIHVNGHQPGAPRQPLLAPGQQPPAAVPPAAPGQQPDAAGKQPDAPGQDPGAAGQDPPAPGQDSPAPGKDPDAAGQDPPAAGQDPPAPGQDPPAPGQQPDAAGKPPDVPRQDPLAPGRGQQPAVQPPPPASAQDPGAPGQQPDAAGQDPGAPGQQPDAAGLQPTVPGQPSDGAGQDPDGASDDRSIMELPEHHSEPGGGRSLRAEPDLVEGSPVKPRPQTNGPDIQTDAVPSNFICF